LVKRSQRDDDWKWLSATGGIGTYQLSNAMTIGDATNGTTMTTGLEVFEGQDNRFRSGRR